jgi:hypothetical protein
MATMQSSGRERARTLADCGWFKPAEIPDLLRMRYGARGVVTYRTIIDWINRASDPLPSERVGGRILVHRDALVAWLQRQGSPRPTEPAPTA